MHIDEEALDFFNELTGNLEIVLDKPAQPVGGLLNLEASPDAKILSVKLVAGVFEEGQEDNRPLTEEELGRVVFETPHLELCGESGEVVAHSAPNGRTFTVRDLLRAVEETERSTRGTTNWLGGVDVHHVYFEGIAETDEGVWEINWGS